MPMHPYMSMHLGLQGVLCLTWLVGSVSLPRVRSLVSLKTQFYHNMFHGVNHKCLSFLGSQRLSKNQMNTGTNSSACEQINLFLQRIKVALKLMSQNHSLFYLQFFIHQWNRCNRKSHSAILSTAFQGAVYLKGTYFRGN